MANEIQISATTGLLINCQLYSGLAAIGIPFYANEIPPMTGSYVASVPSGTPYGRYLVLATVGSNVKIGQGQLDWGGENELTYEYNQIIGLDPNNPSRTTPIDWKAGNIDLTLTGDGVSETTVKRNI